MEDWTSQSSWCLTFRRNMLNTDLTKNEVRLVLAGLDKVLKAKGTKKTDLAIAEGLLARLEDAAEAAYG